MEDSEVTESDGKFFSTPGYPWMGQQEGDTGLVPMLPEDVPKDNAMGEGEMPTKRGGKSADLTGLPAMASSRAILIPESPPIREDQPSPVL